MPVQTPEPIDDEYLKVVRQKAAARGGLAGLSRTAHVAYRQNAMVFHQETFRRRVLEELDLAGFTVEALAAELGDYKGGTLRLWLNGKRAYEQELLFALEWWLRSLDDERPSYSPFARGVIEAARAQGYCRAVQAIREQMLSTTDSPLSQRDFWQLHHMYALRGWQGTSPASPAGFAAQAAAISVRAACEYTETFLELERVDPPDDIDQPYKFVELHQLDNDWGVYYLITRLCLARGADDQHVVGYPISFQPDGGNAGQSPYTEND
jgi:hypothetical protein